MDFNLENLEKEILSATADGINYALETAIQDIRENAPYRSGRLSKSYNIVRYATPEYLDGVIDSNIPYRFGYYPLVERFGRRNRPNTTAPLFAPEDTFESIAIQQIEQSIDRRFQDDE